MKKQPSKCEHQFFFKVVWAIQLPAPYVNPGQLGQIPPPSDSTPLTYT